MADETVPSVEETVQPVAGDQATGPLITRQIRRDLGHTHTHKGKDYSPGADIQLSPTYEKLLDDMGVLEKK